MAYVVQGHERSPKSKKKVQDEAGEEGEARPCKTLAGFQFLGKSQWGDNEGFQAVHVCLCHSFMIQQIALATAWRTDWRGSKEKMRGDQLEGTGMA